MQTQSNPLAAEWHRPVWIALLVAASVAFSLGFACATPIAAFAAIAALTMSRRDSLLLVCLVWFTNQALGFGVLHYPWTVNSLAWGAGLGIIALLSVLGAEFSTKQSVALNGIVASTVAFLSAFGIYEGLLFVASMISQSGLADYAPTIVGRIFAINTIAFIGLLVANRLAVSAGLVPEQRRQLVLTGSRN